MSIYRLEDLFGKRNRDHDPRSRISQPAFLLPYFDQPKADKKSTPFENSAQIINTISTLWTRKIFSYIFGEVHPYSRRRFPLE